MFVLKFLNNIFANRFIEYDKDNFVVRFATVLMCNNY